MSSSSSTNRKKLVDYASTIVASIRKFIASMFFFFFQAEDGIRDTSVTGVQTCALPIWPVRRVVVDDPGERPRGELAVRACRQPQPAAERRAVAHRDVDPAVQRPERRRAVVAEPGGRQIGRASCRERVEGGVVGGRGRTE